MATIESINYNAKTKVLQIVFGYDKEKMYSYKNIPAEIANGLESAQSKGGYFHANIRKQFTDFTWEFIY